MFREVALQLQRNSTIHLAQARGRSLFVQRSFGVFFIPILIDLHWRPSTLSTVSPVDEHEGNDSK